MLIVAGDRGLFSLTDDGQIGTPAMAGGQFMALAVRGSQIAVAVYKQGVRLSDDAGRSWRDIGSDLPHSDVRSITFDPHRPGEIYVGTEPAAIYRFTGGKWVQCGDLRLLPESREWSFPVPPRVAHVRAITASPDDPQLLYALIEVGSFLVSKDGGATWSVATGLGHDLHRVVVHPKRPRQLLVATGMDTGAYRGGRGLYRSGDGGSSWVSANEGLGHRLYTEDAIAFHPDDPDVAFVAAADGIPPRWASLSGMALGVITGNVYFLSPSRFRRKKGADVTIYRTRDAGGHWTAVPDVDRQGLFDMVWALESGRADNGSAAVYFGTTGGAVHASYDAGESWRVVAHDLGTITHLHPLGVL